jgi:hypothetical protein
MIFRIERRVPVIPSDVFSRLRWDLRTPNNHRILPIVRVQTRIQHVSNRKREGAYSGESWHGKCAPSGHWLSSWLRPHQATPSLQDRCWPTALIRECTSDFESSIVILSNRVSTQPGNSVDNHRTRVAVDSLNRCFHARFVGWLRWTFIGRTDFFTRLILNFISLCFDVHVVWQRHGQLSFQVIRMEVRVLD